MYCKTLNLFNEISKLGSTPALPFPPKVRRADDNPRHSYLLALLGFFKDQIIGRWLFPKSNRFHSQRDRARIRCLWTHIFIADHHLLPPYNYGATTMRWRNSVFICWHCLMFTWFHSLRRDVPRT
ncbi:hypothetical protein L6452_35076 [Arctium lappa]|uniref:Uncharacterized protein n=1 Tax=Arctium lappa TaxID=4217 RepID=A0ACB8YJX5_ARCLA|nr:hypothetical protein L6452_35076 [Arctium lappa]